jgi:hypothetical protein
VFLSKAALCHRAPHVEPNTIICAPHQTYEVLINAQKRGPLFQPNKAVPCTNNRNKRTCKWGPLRRRMPRTPPRPRPTKPRTGPARHARGTWVSRRSESHPSGSGEGPMERRENDVTALHGYWPSIKTRHAYQPMNVRQDDKPLQ